MMNEHHKKRAASEMARFAFGLRQLTAGVLSVSVLLMTYSCYETSSALASPDKQQVLKVGFVLSGSVSDLDWNYAHAQGCKHMEDVLKSRVEANVVEHVSESAEVERVMEKMIAQERRLIFSTSYGYLEPLLRVAARHPEVVFMQCERLSPQSAKNVGSYYAVDYPPLYVAGIVAGRMTRKMKLGFVAAHPVPSIIRSLNAFTLGAQSVDPKVKVQVVWTNNWYDPAMAAEATKGLIESGADVIVGCSDSATVTKTAEKNGAYSIGCNVDNSRLAPKGWLTGQQWNWGPYYTQVVRSVAEHKWKKSDTVYGIKEHYSTLASFGGAVSLNIRNEAKAAMDNIESGRFSIFQGPIKNRNGRLQIAKGKIPEAKELDSMNWAVAGVEGALPK